MTDIFLLFLVVILSMALGSIITLYLVLYKLKRIKSLTMFITLSISLILIYTAICLVYPERVNDTLTTCFYACFGGEILSCALIKIFKLKGD